VAKIEKSKNSRAEARTVFCKKMQEIMR